MRLIDADKAIETLEGLTEQISTEGALIVKALVFAALKTPEVIPTEYRHSGYWTKVHGPDNAGNIICECSNCHNCDEFAKNVEVPFCWKCGTKMSAVFDGGSEENAPD